MGFGSQAPGRSAAEMVDAARNLTSIADGVTAKLVSAGLSLPINTDDGATTVGAAEHLQPLKRDIGNGVLRASPCVLLAAIPDAKYESIPAKFDQAQRYFRSTHGDSLFQQLS